MPDKKVYTKMIRKILKNGLLITLMAACGSRGPNMPYASIVSIYESLLLALGVLCCVLGLWGSVICPTALKRARDPDHYKGAGVHASEVLTPLFLSLVMFLGTLFTAVCAPFLKSLNISGLWRVVIKASAAGLSGGIFFVLCSAVFGLMGLVDTFQHIVSRTETETRMKARFMMGTRIKKEEKKD